MRKAWLLKLQWVGLALWLSTQSAQATAFTVINTNLSGPGSFVDILASANASGSSIVQIFFLSAVFDASPQTITIGNNNVITRPMSIIGPAVGVWMKGKTGTVGPVLTIANTAVGSISISDLTFEYGAGGDGGQIRIDATGSVGTVTATFTNCEFYDVVATGRGGGCFVGGGAVATFNRCRFYECVSHSNGGGVAVVSSTATFRSCLLEDNLAMDSGGGIFAVNSTINLESCSLIANAAGSQTYAVPSADGIGDGGGIRSGGSSTVTMINSVVALNSDYSQQADLNSDLHPDISGDFTSDGHNFIGKRDGGTGFGIFGFPAPGIADQVGTILAPRDPGLDGNRVPNWTSPLRDKGDDAAVANVAFILDERDQPRIVGPHVDIGAEEMQYTFTVTTTANSGVGSLRDILTKNAVNRIIAFDPVVFNTPKTITLLSALPTVTEDVIIDASMTAGVTIDGQALHSLFNFSSPPVGEYYAFHSLHLKGGRTTTAGTIAGPAINQPDTSDTLELYNCTISGCSTTRTGTGAIQNSGTLRLENCTLSGNSAINSASGAALTGKATLIHSTVTANSTLSGGPFNEAGGIINLANCIVTGNTASSGLPTLTGIGTLGGNVLDQPIASAQASDFIGSGKISPTLATDGGLVPVHELLLDSPAIENGLASIVGQNMPLLDANLRARTLGSLPDAGASEWETITYAEWKLIVFSTAPAGTLEGSRKDPDNDGVPNGVEYFCGTDPLKFSSNPFVLVSVNGTQTLRYPKAPGRTSQSSVIKSSGNLETWVSLANFPNPAIVSTAGFADIYETVGVVKSKQRFYRLEVAP